MRRILGLMLAVVALGGCSALQQADDVLGAVLAPPASQISGEVSSIDANNQQIQVRTSDGQTGWVRYDSNTKVIYQQREFAVSSLERGDMITMTVQNTGTNNQMYTPEITVTQSVQDRTGVSNTTDSSGLQRVEGNVSRIDSTRGTFEIRSGGNTTVIQLGYNASASVRDKYSRMRVGDYVRLEGRWIGQGVLQVERFN